MSMEGMDEAIIMPTVLYGREVWVMNARDASHMWK